MSAATPEFRTPVMTVVDLSWEDSAGAVQTSRARMEDKSPGGACIRVKKPIDVGAKLRIQWRFDHFSGTTKYCRRDGTEFLVGMQRDLIEAPALRLAPPVKDSLQKNLATAQPLASAARETSVPAERVSPPNPIFVTRANVETNSSIAARASAISAARPDRAEHIASPRLIPQNVHAPPPTEIAATQPARQADKERNRMPRKWMDLPWSSKPENLAANSPDAAENANGDRRKERTMPHASALEEKPVSRTAANPPAFHVELAPMEDIYRAAGIMPPRKGYSIKKVVDMLNSAHMSGLSPEMKRVALLMALDAAEVPVDEVLRDAKARQDALNNYEAAQKKQVEAEWARKAEEVVQIQAELETIKAHYTARISRNLEGVAREKATFNDWLALKKKESDSMTQAAELCVKGPVAEPAVAAETLSKTAAAGQQESQTDGKSVAPESRSNGKAAASESRTEARISTAESPSGAIH
jgi:hypothetical protein